MNTYSTYANITNFGPQAGHAPTNNPLSYCLVDDIDNKFQHSTDSGPIGPYSRNCQTFMSDRCAKNWDGYCEFLSKDKYNFAVNQAEIVPCGIRPCCPPCLTAGEILIRNTAERKYVTQILGSEEVWEPFDYNVANSPLIRYWKPKPLGYCGPHTVFYEVNPKGIDNDPVMNKLLAKPEIGKDILESIKNTMKRKGTLQQLKGTKLGNYFNL